eukprot:TRINITY_DN332_c0_g1_i1.p1 TRINITY_DN332_c0_g1~~TRINITY_DN332_c0_g1_i1.p1  ORF type:complete len:159 (+),score=23.52 TRINITY_DN332_c0_g1_i1:70-546(+)
MPIPVIIPALFPGMLCEKLYGGLPEMSPGAGVLAAISTTMFGHLVRVLATGKSYDNVDPRKQVAESSSQESGGLISRAQAAHLNGWEDLIMFGTATSLAISTGVQRDVVGKIATLHTIARVGFNIAYLTCTTKSLSWIRTMFFLLAYICNTKLLALSQ